MKPPVVRATAKRSASDEKKRTRGFETTGPVAALEVRVFGGGEQPLKRIKVYWCRVGYRHFASNLPQQYTTESEHVESFFH
jgi:hypothetical protein